MKNLSIKNWAKDDRPREKLLKKGMHTLSNAELIAILIGSGNREMSAVELSKFILLESKNNLNTIAQKSIQELMQFKGIGEAKAISILAALELGKRRDSSAIKDQEQIKSSKDVFRLMNVVFRDLPYEEFWVIYLNRSNKIIEKIKMSQGGVSGTLVDIRLILKKAIEYLASSIILSHNHPSGQLHPSQQDKQLTQKLKKAASYLEISVLDHVIIADNQYFSFADENIL
jgi:DNA repair protein RadC